MPVTLSRPQQRLLDTCHDGQMRSDDLLQDFPELSNRMILALLRQLELHGLVEIQSKERVLISKIGGYPRRERTVWLFNLTLEGLARHAPPPDWE